MSVEEQAIQFKGASAAGYLDAELANHPVARAGASVLEPRGELEPLRGRMLETFEQANEDRNGFSVTSRYVIVTAERR